MLAVTAASRALASTQFTPVNDKQPLLDLACINVF